jgi:DNA-binding transcriptional MocR family regulator
VLEAHLRPGDRVGIEDPGFSHTIDLLASLGLVAVPVAIDDVGLLPDALGALLDEGVEALIATPRAQNPSGAAFDASRARDVRRVLARAPDLLVIEDDHAAEVAGADLFPLAETRRARWAFVRSVSKSLGPDLRLAVLAGDAETIARVEGRQRIGIRWVSHVLQRLALALLSDRGVLRSLRVAEHTDSARREALLGALAERGVEAHGRSGLNVWIPVPEESAATHALAAAGWAVSAGERYRLRSGPAIRVTTASLALDEAAGVAEEIARALAPPRLTTTA